MKKKLQNFWFYYKKHLLVAIAVLLVVCYLGSQSAGRDKPDYHIGLVQTLPLPEEALQELEVVFSAAGVDRNGDGKVLVQIHTYYVDLADDSENAGVENAQTVSALDADLIGRVSGLFLLEDVQTFRRITGDILSGSSMPFGDGLTLVPRADTEKEYLTLFERLS